MRRYQLWLVGIVLLAACQRQNEVQLTLIAQNATLQAQIEDIRQTATVDAERLQITVDYMGTLVGRAEEQRVQLQATLIARGTEPATFPNVNAQLATPLPAPDGVAAVLLVTPIPLEDTPLAADSVQPALINITMAPGVGSDDCAVNPTNVFTTTTDEIYVVATGVNITAGTNIAARFAVGAQEIRHDFTPSFDINNACIWFFIDQTDLTFQPGTWSVQLELNNQPFGQPIPFTISGGEAPASGG